jgi:hypothetical protein
MGETNCSFLTTFSFSFILLCLPFKHFLTEKSHNSTVVFFLAIARNKPDSFNYDLGGLWVEDLDTTGCLHFLPNVIGYPFH